MKLCDVVFGNYWYWLRRWLAGEAAAEGIGLAPAPGCFHISKLTTLAPSTVKYTFGTRLFFVFFSCKTTYLLDFLFVK